MVFAKFAVRILEKKLNDYVEGLDKKAFQLNIRKGIIDLERLRLKPSALQKSGLPLLVKAGTIGKIHIKLSWTKLKSEPVEITIQDLFLLIVPDDTYDEKKSAERKRMAKLQKLENDEIRRKVAREAQKEDDTELAGGSKKKKKKKGMGKLARAILENIQVRIKNVHISIEDRVSELQRPHIVGVILKELSLVSTTSEYRDVSFVKPGGKSYKRATLDHFAVYWNADLNYNSFLGLSHDDIIAALRDAVTTGRGLQNVQFRYIIHPVGGTLKLCLNNDETNRAEPRTLALVDLPEIKVDVDYTQMNDQKTMMYFLKNSDLVLKKRGLRPQSLPRPGSPQDRHLWRLWWQYAANSVILDIHKQPLRWDEISERRKQRKNYLHLWSEHIREDEEAEDENGFKMSPERQLELTTLEDKLSLNDILYFRSVAELEWQRVSARSNSAKLQQVNLSSNDSKTTKQSMIKRLFSSKSANSGSKGSKGSKKSSKNSNKGVSSSSGPASPTSLVDGGDTKKKTRFADDPKVETPTAPSDNMASRGLTRTVSYAGSELALLFVEKRKDVLSPSVLRELMSKAKNEKELADLIEQTMEQEGLTDMPDMDSFLIDEVYPEFYAFLKLRGEGDQEKNDGDADYVASRYDISLGKLVLNLLTAPKSSKAYQKSMEPEPDSQAIDQEIMKIEGARSTAAFSSQQWEKARRKMRTMKLLMRNVFRTATIIDPRDRLSRLEATKPVIRMEKKGPGGRLQVTTIIIPEMVLCDMSYYSRWREVMQSYRPDEVGDSPMLTIEMQKSPALNVMNIKLSRTLIVYSRWFASFLLFLQPPTMVNKLDIESSSVMKLKLKQIHTRDPAEIKALMEELHTKRVFVESEDLKIVVPDESYMEYTRERRIQAIRDRSIKHQPALVLHVKKMQAKTLQVGPEIKKQYDKRNATDAEHMELYDQIQADLHGISVHLCREQDYRRGQCGPGILQPFSLRVDIWRTVLFKAQAMRFQFLNPLVGRLSFQQLLMLKSLLDSMNMGLKKAKTGQSWAAISNTVKQNRLKLSQIVEFRAMDVFFPGGASVEIVGSAGPVLALTSPRMDIHVEMRGDWKDVSFDAALTLFKYSQTKRYWESFIEEMPATIFMVQSVVSKKKSRMLRISATKSDRHEIELKKRTRSIQLNAANITRINITPDIMQFVGVLKDELKLAKAAQGAPSNAQPLANGVELSNLLSYPVSVTLYADEVRHDRVTVEAEATKTLPLTAEIFARSFLPGTAPARFLTVSTVQGGAVVGAKDAVQLAFDRPGLFACADPQQKWGIVYEIKPVDSTTSKILVILRSAVQLVNCTSIQFDVCWSASATDRGSSQEFSQEIRPNASSPLPPSVADKGFIWIKPTLPNSSWSQDGLSLSKDPKSTNGLPRPSKIICPGPDGSRHVFLATWKIEEAYSHLPGKDPSPPTRIELSAPVIIENLLPWPIRIHLSNSVKPTGPSSASPEVSAGAECPSFSDPASDIVTAAFSLDGSTWTEPIAVTAPSFKKSNVEISGSEGFASFTVEVDHQKKGQPKSPTPSVRRITVYSPYWLLNKTESDLALQVEGQTVSVPSLLGFRHVTLQTCALRIPKTLGVRLEGEKGPFAILVVNKKLKKGVLRVPREGTSGEDLTLKVEKASGKAGARTRVITLLPHTIIVNQLDRPIFYSGADRARDVHLPHRTSAAIQLGNLKDVKSLCIRPLNKEIWRRNSFAGFTSSFSRNHDFGWSKAVPIDPPGSRVVQLFNAKLTISIILRVSSELKGSTRYVFINEESDKFTFEIVNESKSPVTFGQLECEQTTLEPGETAGFAWQNFDLPLVLGVSQGASRAQIDLQKQKPEEIPFGSGQINVELENGTRRVTILGPTGLQLASKTEEEEAYDSASPETYELQFPQLQVCLLDDRPREVLNITLENFTLMFDRAKGEYMRVELSASNLQVDNQCSILRRSCFPVMAYFHSRTPLPDRSTTPAFRLSLWKTGMNSDLNADIYRTLSFHLKAGLEIQIDEEGLVPLIKWFDSFKRAKSAKPHSEICAALIKPADVKSLKEPKIMYMEAMSLPAIAVDITFRKADPASPDMLPNATAAFGVAAMNLDRAPLRFSPFYLDGVAITKNELKKRLTKHFTRQLGMPVAAVLGSVDLFGAVSGIFRDVAAVSDARGVEILSSLFRALSSPFHSTMKISSSLARGVDALSLDPSYISIHSTEVAERPNHIGDGLVLGAKNLGLGLLRGLAGLFLQPCVSAHKKGPKAFAPEILRGVIGLGVKPVSGALGAVSKVSEGVYNTADYLSPRRFARTIPSTMRLPRPRSASRLVSPYSATLAEDWVLLSDSAAEDGPPDSAMLGHVELPDKFVLVATDRHLVLLRRSSQKRADSALERRPGTSCYPMGQSKVQREWQVPLAEIQSWKVRDDLSVETSSGASFAIPVSLMQDSTLVKAFLEDLLLSSKLWIDV